MTDSFNPSPELLTSERCYLREYLNKADLPDVSVAGARVAPGVTTELHALSVLEWYVIESGRGLMKLGDRELFAVGPGDTVEIPPGCNQQITNTGKNDLLFFCVCVPRFTPEYYSSRE